MNDQNLRFSSIAKSNGMYAMICIAPAVIILVFSSFAPLKAMIYSRNIKAALDSLHKIESQPESKPQADSTASAEEKALLEERRKLISDEREAMKNKNPRDIKGEREIVEKQLQLIKDEQEFAKREQEDLKKKDEAQKALLFNATDPFNVNSTHMIWVAFTNIYFTVFAFALLIGGWLIFVMGPSSTRSKIVIVAIAIITSILAAVFAKKINPYWDLPGLISQAMYNDWEKILIMKGVSERAILFAGMVLTFACGMLIYRLPQTWKMGEDETRIIEKEFATRVKGLRLLLYVAAALLVSKLFQSNAFFTWAGTYFNFQDAGKGFDGLKSSLITQEAISYTVFLAAFYLPAFFLVRAKSVEYAESQAGTESEQNAILEKQGLNFSFWEQLPKIVAILAPLLAGPVGELLKLAFRS